MMKRSVIGHWGRQRTRGETSEMQARRAARLGPAKGGPCAPGFRGRGVRGSRVTGREELAAPSQQSPVALKLFQNERDVKQPTGFMVNEPLTSEQGTVTTCRNYGKCVLRIWHLRTCEHLHFRQGKTCSAVNTTRQHEASFDMEGRENTLEQARLLAVGLCSHAGSCGRCSCSRTSP